jgi:predicted RNA-binding protein with PUA-like domain
MSYGAGQGALIFRLSDRAIRYGYSGPAPRPASGVDLEPTSEPIPNPPRDAMAKHYWLMKSEAEAYSIDDLERDGTTLWDGIRNYRARNNMRAMKEGDLVLYYHSRQDPPAVTGLARVVKESYPDPTQFDPASKYFDEKSSEDDPRWWLVDIAFVRKFERVVSLHDVKDEASLSDMVLVNNSRLSVQPVKASEFRKVLAMAGETPPA